MTGPGHELAAAGWGHLRASNADREQVIGTLKAAFVQGRLDRDEFGLRVGQALGSRTYAELAVLTADLPAGMTGARPPGPARVSVNKKVAAALACATAGLVGMWHVAQMIPDGSPLVLLPVVTATLLLMAAVLGGWLGLLAAWLHDRASRRSPRRLPPSAGGQASRRLPPADPGRQLPPGNHGHRHTAEAAPIGRPRLQPS